MQVVVKAFLDIRELIENYPGEGGMRLILPDGITVRDLLERLALPTQRVGLILINGNYAKEDVHLKEGDVVQLFPVLEGG